MIGSDITTIGTGPLLFYYLSFHFKGALATPGILNIGRPIDLPCLLPIYSPGR